MKIRNTEKSYGAIALSFHWIIAFMIAALVIVADIMTDMAPSAEKWELYGLHKSFGITVLFLVALRLLWRFTNPVPRLPEGTPWHEKMAAHGAHLALYLLMAAMPISGYMMSMGGGHGINVFGMWQVPDFIGKNADIGKLGSQIHEFGETGIYLLVGIHVAAALFHYFVKKDDILPRMLPFLKKRS